MLSPPDTTRRVQRLRLSAPDEGRARRGLRLVDDALRTASLPDSTGRLLIVKKLALKFAADASPQTVSLKLQALIAALQLQAVHAASSGAGQAAAVWFRDALEVHVLAALRLSARAPLNAWFWPLALPALACADGSRPGLRAVLLSQSGREEAPAALPEFVRRLVAAGQGHALIACLGDADAQLLLAAARLPRMPVGTRDPLAAHGRRKSDAALRLAAMADTPAGDARVQCMTSLLLAAQGMPPFAVPRTASHAKPPAALTVARRVRTSQVSTDDPAAPATGIESRTHAGSSGHPAQQAVGCMAGFTVMSAVPPSGQVFTGCPPGDAEAPRDAPGPEAGGAQADASWHHPITPISWLAGAPTAAGGLLFLLPVLARLGWVEWIAAAPEWHAQRLERCLFARICGRLALPADDPAWQLTMPCIEADTPRSFSAPACWRKELADRRSPWALGSTAGNTRLRDASGRLLLAALGGRPVDEACAAALAAPADSSDLRDAVIGAWLTACRRWLRRRARISLASLVLRPARLSLTTTHADLEFELSTTDLAIRRAGLDIDLGWLPWYGRVVRFHYGDSKAAPWT
jgi:hypothetical protein